MRVSRQEMEHCHRRIVEGASRLMRERGVRGTSVADAMKEAEMTHGGFYRHFASKEELTAAALAKAFEDFSGPLELRQRIEPPQSVVEEFKALYLSDEHVQDPGHGCPMPILSGEIAREGLELRAVFGAGIRSIIAALVSGLPPGPGDRQSRAALQLCTLVGAVALARASDNNTARLLLDAARAALEVRSP